MDHTQDCVGQTALKPERKDRKREDQLEDPGTEMCPVSCVCFVNTGTILFSKVLCFHGPLQSAINFEWTQKWKTHPIVMDVTISGNT